MLITKNEIVRLSPQDDDIFASETSGMFGGGHSNLNPKLTHDAINGNDIGVTSRSVGRENGFTG